MSTRRESLPKYRKHKASGQAVVELNGRVHYLGPHGTRASKLEFDRLIGEWLAAGRCLPSANSAGDLTIVELVSRYWKFAQAYYVKDGRPTGAIFGIRVALRLLKEHYGRTRASECGPLALKSLQRRMVESGQSRRYVNDNIDRLRRLFRWAVHEELVSAVIYQALMAVPGLRKGRTDARESPPVRPVSGSVVDATVPHLPKVVAAMVRFQQLTGCRPGEVCTLKPADIDQSSDVWIYRPASHKTEHHDCDRTIYIGPLAQQTILPYLSRDPDEFCFAPAESEQIRNAERRSLRKSPLTPSQRRRRPKSRPRRRPGDRYTPNSYRRAIHRACGLAFPMPADLAAEQCKMWRKAHQWHPNRLRHAAATEIRKQFGLEAAQVCLGHSQADVSQIYAERDQSLGLQVMRQIG